MSPADSTIIGPLLAADDAREVYRLMTLARQFEEQLGDIFAAGKLSGWFHSCAGHEATQSGLHLVLNQTDHLIPYHRSRVSLFSKGMTAREVAAEMMGRTTAQSKGRGGDGHIIHPARRIYGMSGVLGAGAPIAAGVAYSAKLRGQGEVVIHAFGDGTSARGAVAEGLNLAMVADLPVVFIVENNFYGEFTPLRNVLRAEHISDRAIGIGMPSEIVDGNDPEASLVAIRKAIDRARSGDGPTLIEAKTYRLKGHYEGDPQSYRDKEEISQWSQRDPVLRFRERLLDDGRANDQQLMMIDAEMAAEVTDAMEYGLASPRPTVAELTVDVYADEGGKEKIVDGR